MVRQIGRFATQPVVISGDRGQRGFHALLAHFLRDARDAGIEQLAGVARICRGLLAPRRTQLRGLLAGDRGQRLLDVAALVAYTSSGSSALRMARERPRAPIVGMTPLRGTARRLALVWGVNPVLCHDVASVAEMTEVATATVSRMGFASSGQTVVIAAGMPFGTAGTTNLLRIAQID